MRIPLRGPLVLTVLALAAAGASVNDGDPPEPARDRFALLFGGELGGRLEPCGCSKDLLGGLPRRLTAVARTRAEGVPVVVVENGDLTGDDGGSRQDALKREVALDLLAASGTRALAAGAAEYRAGLDAVALAARDRGVALVASNAPAGSRAAEIEVVPVALGDRTVRVAFAALADPGIFAPGTAPPGLRAPAAALDGLLARLRAAGDYRVVLYRGPLAAAKGLAREGVDLIVAGDGEDLGGYGAERAGGTWIATYGTLGKALGRVDVSAPAGGPMESTFRWVSLTGEIADDPGGLLALDVYQQGLAAERIVETMPRVPHPDGAFAGSDACLACHGNAAAAWRASDHARAYETLVGVRRAADPECVVCHVVGLEHAGGFTSPERTPSMKGVGCESCHGPGAAHAAAPSTPFAPLGLGSCVQCHDAEHAPGFDAAAAWPKIAHR